jgi:hypothetical protein
MKLIIHSCTFVALLLCPGTLLSGQNGPPPAVKGKPAIEKHINQTHVDPAERVFQTNCSRCHYAPEGLSPRITGTVVRHMRVRANLSAEEERMILSYLNP